MKTWIDYDNVTFMPVLFNSYLQMFNTSDLSFYMEIDTVVGPKWATQNRHKFNKSFNTNNFMYDN